jgi:hypothetical protein
MQRVLLSCRTLVLIGSLACWRKVLLAPGFPREHSSLKRFPAPAFNQQNSNTLLLLFTGSAHGRPDQARNVVLDRTLETATSCAIVALPALRLLSETWRRDRCHYRRPCRTARRRLERIHHGTTTILVRTLSQQRQETARGARIQKRY